MIPSVTISLMKYQLIRFLIRTGTDDIISFSIKCFSFISTPPVDIYVATVHD